MDNRVLKGIVVARTLAVTDVEPLARIAGVGCRYVIQQDPESPEVVVFTYGEGSTVALAEVNVFADFASALRAVADDIERDL